jgi:hypothetical protein
VTVCVAAICGGNIILGASDRMLTAGDVEFEPETAKIYSLTNSTVAMIAGESSLQISILERLYQFVAQRLKDKPAGWIPLDELADQYHRIYQDIKSAKAEARVLGPLGLTLDNFVRRQHEMAPSFIAELTREIINLDMPAIEAIITGIDTTGAHIYVISTLKWAVATQLDLLQLGSDIGTLIRNSCLQDTTETGLYRRRYCSHTQPREEPKLPPELGSVRICSPWALPPDRMLRSDQKL